MAAARGFVAMRCHRSKNRRGFALMDVMIAMVIVATGVIAIIQLFATGTPANAAATRIMIATRLAQNVQEHALSLSENDVRALHGETFAVIDSSGQTLTGFTGWEQVVELYATSPADLSQNLPISTTAAGRPKRLIVSVKFNDELVYKEHWLIAPTLE